MILFLVFCFMPKSRMYCSLLVVSIYRRFKYQKKHQEGGRKDLTLCNWMKLKQSFYWLELGHFVFHSIDYVRLSIYICILKKLLNTFFQICKATFL